MPSFNNLTFGYSPSACRAMVDEMEWAISQVDPKKMIQTGSFRINPDGSQSIREVRVPDGYWVLHWPYFTHSMLFICRLGFYSVVFKTYSCVFTVFPIIGCRGRGFCYKTVKVPPSRVIQVVSLKFLCHPANR